MGITRSERSRGDQTLPDGRALDAAVFEQDCGAFVAALDVPANARLRSRQGRDIARARLELERLTAELDALADELEAAKRARDERDYSQLPTLRRLVSGPRLESLEEEVEVAKRRLAKKQAEVQATRIRTEALERDAYDPMYRLHSAKLSVGCSKRQYERLSGSQRTTPVSLTTRNGLRWWWYRDRFWWADARLGPGEVVALVLASDLSSHDQREAFEHASASLLSGNGATPAPDVVPEHVRQEVWIRDRGRCVDCDDAASLAFDFVLPLCLGGSSTVPNLELRCRPCQQRRRANESRATVGKARIGAHAAKEWGVELRDLGWPRAS